MRKFLFVTVLLLTIISCSKQPKCNDDEVQKLVVETLKKKISNEVEAMFKDDSQITENENYTSFLPLIKNRTKYIDELQPKLFNFRSTDVNKDIQKCNCEADLNIIEKNSNGLKEIENDWVGGEFGISNFTPTIKYSAQLTDEKKIYINIENSDEIEIIKRNIFAKVLYDIIQKNKILSKSSNSSSQNYSEADAAAIADSAAAVVDAAATATVNSQSSIHPGNYYTIYGSAQNPVFFYNSANNNDRMNSRFTTVEKVYVESISNDFGYVRFTNTNNQTSRGWIRFVDLN